MSLVSGYATGGAYYGADFYPSETNTAPAMGVTRYQWPHQLQHNALHDMTSSWMSAHHQSSASQVHHHPPHGAIMGVTECENYPQSYVTEYSNMTYATMETPQIKVRVVKRKVSANKKERRRTISINSAFSALRGCIPNVPTDTKLSKIKTLRLATSYIAYLMDVLNKDDPNMAEAFKAEVTKKTETVEERRKKEAEEMMRVAKKDDRRCKGRTGWPQAVWASELKTTDHVNGTGCGSEASSCGEQDTDT